MAVEKKIFEYRGKNKSGKSIKGEIEAATLDFARLLLTKQGIKVSSIKKQSGGLFGGGKQKITGQEVSIVLRQISTMLTAGITIVQALGIIAMGNPNKTLRKNLLDINAKIEGGSQLSVAIAGYPDMFDTLSVSLIAAGEKAGSLDKLMDKLATYKEKNDDLKKKVKKAMNYPIAVIGIAVAVSTLLLVKVVPQFSSVFAGFGAELPAFTQIIVDMSEGLIKNGIYIVIVSVVGFIMLKKSIKSSPAMRLSIDGLLITAPLVSKIVRGSAVSRFARTLSTMFAAGVPLTEALYNVAPATGNLLYQNAINKIAQDISQGDQMNVSFRRHSALFDEFVIQLIQIGEEAGSLEAMLEKIADFYESEVDNLVDNMSSLIEPLVITILGVMVGGLVVAMYLPIFKLGSVVG